MSDKKPTNILNMKPVDDDQSHSDSDDSTEETPKTLLKTEKKKPIISNFGRPRKHPYKPGKYKCMYCETMCSKPSVLTKHLRAHTNERPFPCGLCKRSFKTKSNLSKHEKSKSHSSKLEENSVVHNKQSKREKAEMMLQALSGMESIYPRHVESMTNIEFDSNERKTSIVESNCSSPALSEDKSINSEENCVHDNVKKEKHVDHASSYSEDIPGKVENASSCSGVLTINSQAGPITVEVQINLETMRHLQQGLSNITNKKITSPLSPVPVATPRNDAELRAAESILHMANQWTHIPETLNSKDDFRKNGATVRKLPDTLSPLHRGSPDMINFCKTNVAKPLSSKDSNSNKSTPLEESDMVNFKNQTKCLVKENLLKKMKRKQVQENNNISSAADSPVINGPVLINHVFSNSKMTSDKVSESVLSPSISRASHVKFNPHIRSDSMLKNLIADSKSTTVLSIKANKRGSGIFPNSQILNSFSISSQSPTIVVLTPTSSTTKTLLSDSKSVSDMILVSNSESNNNKAIFDIDTATLSKVITNTQSLHQHQATTASKADILSVTNSITASRVATVSSPCIESDSKENMSVENVNELVIDEQSIEDDKSEKQPFSKKTSIQTSQESENELSPRLCIVEESSNTEPYLFDKKLTESDEEIDVVNTDSDEERLSLQRIPQVNYSESASKRRKLNCDDDSEMVQSDTKRAKEVEKCVPLHAPNINAKDLMQDCPLNLSANRQPTILPVPPIPVSVLHNLYQSISPSSVSVSSSINSTNAQETSSPISVLTNHNPAHPQSFQNFQSTTPLSTNGHHRDYPIFEDKIACEECGSLIEPGMMALHNNMHIYTSSKDSHIHGNNNTKSGSSITPINNSNNNNSSSTSSSSKIPFNRPRSYKCVVCNIAFRVIGHLRKHHKSKSHLQGLVNSGLLSKTLFSKIEQSKVPIQEVIDQKTGNIIPDVLSRYISNWSQANNESEPQH